MRNKIRVHKDKQLFSYEVAIDKIEKDRDILSDIVEAVKSFYELPVKYYRDFVITFTIKGNPINALTISKNYTNWYPNNNEFDGTVDIMGNPFFVRRERVIPTSDPKENIILKFIEDNRIAIIEDYKKELEDGKWDKAFIDYNELKRYRTRITDKIENDKSIKDKEKEIKNKVKKKITRMAIAKGVRNPHFINTIRQEVLDSHLNIVAANKVAEEYGKEYKYVAFPEKLKARRAKRLNLLKARSVGDGYFSNVKYEDSYEDIVRCTVEASKFYKKMSEEMIAKESSKRDKLGYNHYRIKVDDGINYDNLLDDYD